MNLSTSHAADWTRREWIKAGAFGLLGASLPDSLAIVAQAGERARPKAKQVLVIMEQGCVSHLDSSDPKPNMVAEHRRPFQPMQGRATRIFGLEDALVCRRTNSG